MPRSYRFSANQMLANAPSSATRASLTHRCALMPLWNRIPRSGRRCQRSSSSFENPAQRHHLYLILRQPCSHRLRYLCGIVGIAMNARAVRANGNTRPIAQGDCPLARKDKRPFGDALRRPAPLRPFRDIGSGFIVFEIDEPLPHVLQSDPGRGPFGDLAARDENQVRSPAP